MPLIDYESCCGMSFALPGLAGPYFVAGYVPSGLMAYNTITQTRVDYCLTVWGYAPKYQIQRVQQEHPRGSIVDLP